MSAWKNEKGKVLFRMHDDNEALGDGDSFMKMKDWEDIEPVWQEYAQEQFSEHQGMRWRTSGQGRLKTNSKPAFELKMDGEGMLLLLDIINTKLEEKKAIMYLLADVDLKEPLKLQIWDTTTLLHFWLTQQETGKGPTFLFKAWKNKDEDMVSSVISGNLPSPQTQAKSDKESATHHTEHNVDNDLADGRPLLKKPRTEGPTPRGPAVPHSIPKPCPAKPAKKGALLTSQMEDLLAGLTEDATGEVRDDVEMEESIMPPAQKRRRGT
ncbi:hypothetical protein BDR06DRAFT_1002302 [Suillus hirtellus]|nr:hypothetical protein BDR06DRAFT_1002302 [Suillus hirtellus]